MQSGQYPNSMARITACIMAEGSRIPNAISTVAV